MDYNAKEPSSSRECACEAERLLNQAARSGDANDMNRRIAAADVWARLAQAAAVREATDRTTEK
jgi:hypothetical protein